MFFSPNFKSSPQCVPSPDGRLIATLTSTTTILIRSTQTLETVTSLKLPPSLGPSIHNLIWSPSSTIVLVSTSDQLHAQSINGPPIKATIQNPASSTGRPAHIQFGARDTEVLVFSAFGIKLLIYDLSTSQAVEIPSPKFHQPTTAPRGLSIRNGTDSGELALLTRVNGRDTISVHRPVTRQLERSWHPDAHDVQGMVWEGGWLIVWESPAYGHRLLLYTPDGQLFRTLSRFGRDGNEEDTALEPGIKLCRLRPDGQRLIVGDHSRSVTVLDTGKWKTDTVLTHPTTIDPQDTLQVWQEQLGGTSSLTSHTFIRATQSISPSAPTNESTRQALDGAPGCSFASFDASSALLVTRLDDSPNTLWIWDLMAAELRAVLLFHSRVDCTWHPTSRELLLIRCVDEAGAITPFTWDPLSEGPMYIPLAEQLSSGAGPAKKSQIVWLNTDVDAPTVLLSDGKTYCLCALAEASPAGWQGASGSYESMLEGDSIQVDLVGDETSMLEDTFSFKHG